MSVDPRSLVAARRAAGLRPAELARQLGVDRQLVWKWENGLASPGPHRLPAIGEALGVPVHTLMAKQHSPLRILRLQAGLTLAELAAALGVPLTTYAGWERAGLKRGLPTVQLRALTAALRADIDTVRRALTPENR